VGWHVETAAVPSNKGRYIRIDADIVSPRSTLSFDSAFVTLRLDQVVLVPVERVPEGISNPRIPSVLEKGKREKLSVVFAVPDGSFDATLCVLTSLDDESHATNVPMRIVTRATR
jgi:hypothetical protein